MGNALVIGWECMHLGLAIVDLWSDANLLLDIQDTQAKYEDNQETIDADAESNQYLFDECLVSNTTSEWDNETTTYCICDQFDVACDGNEFVIEEIDLFGDIITVNLTLSPDQYVEIAKEYIECNEFNLAEWECSICHCDGDEYNKQQSIPLKQAIQEYDQLNDTQIQYCNPNSLLKDEYNEYLDNIIIVAWTFLILGSLIQCCAVCGRFYLAYIKVEDHVGDDDEEGFFIKILQMIIAWMVRITSVVSIIIRF